MKIAMLAIAVALWLASPAHADEGLTRDQLAAAMAAAGFKMDKGEGTAGAYWTGTLTTPADRIGEQSKTIKFDVFSYNCPATGEDPCSNFTLVANFPFDGTVSEELKQAVNEFNKSSVLGRAYYTDEAACVDYVVIVDGDLGPSYFERRIAVFPELIDEFLSLADVESGE